MHQLLTPTTNVAPRTRLHAHRTCGNDDVYVPPPRRGLEARIVYPRKYSLHFPISHPLHPYHLGNRARPNPMLVRAYHTFTRVERRNDGESPGAIVGSSFILMADATLWPASPGTGPRGTDRRGSRISVRSCLTCGTASLLTMCRCVTRPGHVARFV
jgi:hypothetical protein